MAPADLHMAIPSVAISLGQRLAAPHLATVETRPLIAELGVRVEPVFRVPQAALKARQAARQAVHRALPRSAPPAAPPHLFRPYQ